ncbi:phospho-sugar mutase [Dermabacteraceae bacterium P7074]
MSIQAELAQRAEAWLADDPNPATAEELTALLSAAKGGDEAAARELSDAFAGTLQFGTAGLRGKMGPGPNRMNLAVVSRAARGLATYMNEKLAGEDRPGRAVVGYDARYNSRDFAEATVAIFAAAGIEAHLLPGTWPTPVLAFATRYLDADAGVMVTASHNPAQDNGYKVYLGGRLSDEDGRGVQIVPPADAEIAAHIAAVGAVREIPRADSGWHIVGEELRDAYLEQIQGALENGGPREVRIVHTAMHGVGYETMSAAFRKAGFTDVHPVEEQRDPDPDFPTVSFPNPEEKGAIDLALEKARAVSADVVIANDPDADRCAAAVLDPHSNEWRMLRGDELGVLLGSYLLQTGRLQGTLANSIVSSRWLSEVARVSGAGHATTLTGFKWIARTPGLGFGYEEAIGYCVLPEVVRDKDGISAALVVAEMAALAKQRGTSLVGVLDDLAQATGLFVTDQLSLRVEDLSLIPQMMQRLRSTPPAALAGSTVSQVEDLAEGSLETTGLPPTDGMLFATEDGSRVIVRPSGTEPKLKCYLEAVEKVGSAGIAEARADGAEKIARVRADIAAALGVG